MLAAPAVVLFLAMNQAAVPEIHGISAAGSNWSALTMPWRF